MRKTIVTVVTVLVLAVQLAAQAKLKVLHNFGSSNEGNVPSGPLLPDAHGNLYGATGGGPGQSGFGVVICADPAKQWGVE